MVRVICATFVWVAMNVFSAWLTRDIAGMVAAMTEGDPGVGVKKLIDNSIPG